MKTHRPSLRPSRCKSRAATSLSKAQSADQWQRARKRAIWARWRRWERRAWAAASADMRPGCWQKAVIRRTSRATVAADSPAGLRKDLILGREAVKIMEGLLPRQRSGV